MSVTLDSAHMLWLNDFGNVHAGLTVLGKRRKKWSLSFIIELLYHLSCSVTNEHMSHLSSSGSLNQHVCFWSPQTNYLKIIQIKLSAVWVHGRQFRDRFCFVARWEHEVKTLFVLDLSHVECGVEISCCVLQFAVARRPLCWNQSVL